MPGVLLCESVFKRMLFIFQRKWKLRVRICPRFTDLISLSEAKFKQMVKPGDEITIEAEFEKLSKFFLTGQSLKTREMFDFEMAANHG